MGKKKKRDEALVCVRKKKGTSKRLADDFGRRNSVQRGDFWTSKGSTGGGAESSNVAFVWDLVTLWQSCHPPSAAFPTGERCPQALGLCSAVNRETSTYCKLSISLQHLHWGPAIGPVVVNPVFVFTRYISCLVFWNSLARSSDG